MKDEKSNTYARIACDYWWKLTPNPTVAMIAYSLFVDRLTVSQTAVKHKYKFVRVHQLKATLKTKCDKIIERAMLDRQQPNEDIFAHLELMINPIHILPLPAKAKKEAPKENKPTAPPNIPIHTHVFDMDLNYRTKRILWHLQIHTLVQLIKTPITQIKAVRSCNDATIQDIKRELARFGVA